MAVGIIFTLCLLAAILVAFGGALTGKGRAQRTADLAALSAARSLRDDLPRRLSPPMVNGVPNPAHLTKAAYLRRARLAAHRGAIANGASPLRLRVSFPDRLSPAPLRARVRLLARLRSGGGRGPERDRGPVSVTATAEARPALSLSGFGASASVSAVASGGGYSGPLAIRQGRGIRPDAAAAFGRWPYPAFVAHRGAGSPMRCACWRWTP